MIEDCRVVLQVLSGGMVPHSHTTSSPPWSSPSTTASLFPASSLARVAREGLSVDPERREYREKRALRPPSLFLWSDRSTDRSATVTFCRIRCLLREPKLSRHACVLLGPSGSSARRAWFPKKIHQGYRRGRSPDPSQACARQTRKNGCVPSVKWSYADLHYD
jgi:hypothetical protein